MFDMQTRQRNINPALRFSYPERDIGGKWLQYERGRWVFCFWPNCLPLSFSCGPLGENSWAPLLYTGKGNIPFDMYHISEQLVYNMHINIKISLMNPGY